MKKIKRTVRRLTRTVTALFVTAALTSCGAPGDWEYDAELGTAQQATKGNLNNVQEECEDVLTVRLNAGWNMFSVNAEGDMRLDSILSSLDLQDGDFVASQMDGFAMYYDIDGYQGFFGSLETLEVGKGYKINLARAGELRLSSHHYRTVDPRETEIHLHDGWNWVGSTLSEALPLGRALAGFHASEGDIIKNDFADQRAIFRNGEWVGNVDTVGPGDAFKLQVRRGGCFTMGSAGSIDIPGNVLPTDDEDEPKEEKEELVTGQDKDADAVIKGDDPKTYAKVNIAR